MPQPIVLGHEGAGIVEKSGRGHQGPRPAIYVLMSYNSCGMVPAASRTPRVVMSFRAQLCRRHRPVECAVPRRRSDSRASSGNPPSRLTRSAARRGAVPPTYRSRGSRHSPAVPDWCRRFNSLAVRRFVVRGVWIRVCGLARCRASRRRRNDRRGGQDRCSPRTGARVRCHPHHRRGHDQILSQR